MKTVYQTKALKLLNDDLKTHTLLDPMKDIVFKSILKKDETHLIIRVLVKELLGLELFDIKKKIVVLQQKERIKEEKHVITW